MLTKQPFFTLNSFDISYFKLLFLKYYNLTGMKYMLKGTKHASFML